MPRPLLIFSHANSFVAGTYKLMFSDLERRGFEVCAIPRLGHDPQYPVSDNWDHLAQQVMDYAQHHIARADTPAFLAGHSLGGFLSLMAAARAPQDIRGVLLLDAPILGGWRATTLGMMKRTDLVGSVSPGAVSRHRRTHWPSFEAALEHFQHKRAFAKWHPQVLHDYISHGTHDEGEGEHKKRVLSFDRAIETAIYNTLPDNLERLLKRHPVKCPVGFIGGTHSVEMRQVGMTMTEKLTKGRILMIDGSHLFPMEKPLAAGAAMEAALRDMGAFGPH